ncbi:MAG: hypothetical protein AAFV88_17595, partial [Planctomycetota bacterium]
STAKSWAGLQRRSVELLDELIRAISANQNSASATMTELVGQGIVDIDSSLDATYRRVGFLAGSDLPPESNQQVQLRREVSREAKRIENQCKRLRDLVQARLALTHAASMFADVMSLRRNVDRLIEQPPQARTARYANLLLGQFVEIDRLFDDYKDQLPARVLQHLRGEHWSRWSQRWALRLQVLAEENAGGAQFASVLRTLAKELEDKSQQVIENSSFDNAIRHGRDLRKETRFLADLTEALGNAGRKWSEVDEKTKSNRNAEDAADLGFLTRWHRLNWDVEKKRLLTRVAGQERLHRAATTVDLEYASDLGLFSRALRNVTRDGYNGYGEQSAAEVFDGVIRAIAVLQASSQFAGVRRDLLAMAEGERVDDDSPSRKVFHLLWYRMMAPRLELGIRHIGRGKVDFERQVRILDEVRYNEDHRQVESRLDSRRWRKDPMVSAVKPMEMLAADLETGWKSLADVRETARKTLRRYVLDVAEQAQQAAEAAREAAQETDRRADESASALEDVQPKQEDAIEQAMETMESLIDEANTTDLLDAEQRERARDADAAAELIAEAANQAKEAIEQAESAVSDETRSEASERAEAELNELAERLESTAEHFEKLQNGQDVSESREALREAEDQLQSSLEERYDQAEAMAEKAKQDPRELLRQLEEELKTNEAMQGELSEISKDLVDEAAKTLRQASEDETRLERRLENEDRSFAERKRQQRALLDGMLRRTRTLSDITLQSVARSAERSGKEAGGTELRKAVDELRNQTRDVAEQAERAAGGDATMQEIQSASKTLGQQLESARKATERLATKLDQMSQQSVHEDSKKRDRADRDMRREQNQLRNDELKAIDQQRRDWQNAERDARQRVQSADKSRRAAEQARKNLESRLSKDPENQSLQNEKARQQERELQAERAANQARETESLAKQRSNERNERAKELNRQRMEPLARPNPAAEFGQRVASQAAESMGDLARELSELAGDASVRNELKPPKETAENLERIQSSIKEDVEDVAQDLDRASRHESRLEKPELAEALSEAAEQTRQQAGQKTEQAEAALAETVDDPDVGSAAGDQIRDAAEALAEQADQLEQQFQGGKQTGPSQPSPQDDSPSSQSGAGDPQSSQANTRADPTQAPGKPSGQNSNPAESNANAASPPADANAPSPEEMARTLDELDRSLTEQSSRSESPSPDQIETTPSETQAGTQPNSKPSSSDQQSGNQPPQKSSQSQMQGSADSQGSSSQSSPGQAIDASPTLAQMLESMRQQAARERMKQLQQAKSGDLQEGSATPEGPSEAGQGEPPEGSNDVRLLEDAFSDSAWGALRERESNDDTQGRSSRLPRGYSNEIQAYFKAIAQRAAEEKE